MSSALADTALKVRLSNAARRDDPLAYWRWGFDEPTGALARIKQAFGLFVADNPIDELHLRACNKGTKTETVAAFIIACLQKRSHLNGVELPQWSGPVEAAQLVLDFPQQLLSVQPAYLRVLGGAAYHPRYHGEILSSLRVKPIGGSDDESTWSVVHFLSQKNKQSGIGVRGDIVAFDEPPNISILQELRKAAHANRRGIIIIGETPTLRRQWAPLHDDYGKSPRMALRRVDQERAEVRWSLNEVAEFVLPIAEKNKLVRKYVGPDWTMARVLAADADEVTRVARDKLALARIHGDYTDTSGMCPFDLAVLARMLDDPDYCTDPEIVQWRIRQKVMEGGVQIEKEYFVPVEVWEKPKYGARYYICIDPASGVAGGHPLGLHVVEWGTGDLVARYLGHDSPYVLGVLAAGLGRQYNTAMVQPEINDGWATGVFNGLTDNRYGNIGKEQVELKPGEWHPEYGFRTNAKTRGGMISAVQNWINDWGAGIRYAKCPSRDAISNLMDIILDENDKAVMIPGAHHGEDMILRGQSLKKCVNRRGMEIPDSQAPFLTQEQEMIRLIRGGRDNGALRPPGDGSRFARVERPSL